MEYELESFQELVDNMASCEQLGLTYEVRKEFREVESFFIKRTVGFYLLTVGTE